LLSPADVHALLQRHGLRPSKALGQHFLADPNTARRIVRLAELRDDDTVVEVGPGLGSLTLALCAARHRVRALELDRYVVPVLRELVAGCDVDVVEGDAMRVDWRALLDDAPRWAMVANLPYNVATTIVIDALEHAPMIDRFLVMVQREAGERLAAGPGDGAYGAVSVKVAYYSQASVAGRVPATVFLPRPNVESVLVQLVQHPVPPVDVADAARMFALVRAGFATRRKMLRGALSGMVDAAAFERAAIDSAARAETLSLADWARLANAS